MPELGERIESLGTKLKALEAKQLRINDGARVLTSPPRSQDNTRRKILIGAMILARIDRHQPEHATLQYWLDAISSSRMTGRFLSSRPERAGRFEMKNDAMTSLVARLYR